MIKNSIIEIDNNGFSVKFGEDARFLKTENLADVMNIIRNSKNAKGRFENRKFILEFDNGEVLIKDFS